MDPNYSAQRMDGETKNNLQSMPCVYLHVDINLSQKETLEIPGSESILIRGRYHDPYFKSLNVISPYTSLMCIYIYVYMYIYIYVEYMMYMYIYIYKNHPTFACFVCVHFKAKSNIKIQEHQPVLNTRCLTALKVRHNLGGIPPPNSR